MGLTIHYQGQLHSEAAYGDFIDLVEEFATSKRWSCHKFEEAHRELVRTLQPEDPDAAEIEEIYDGPTRGVYLLPHPDCEPLTFEFDRYLFMQDWCKTQFAGPDIHAAIIRLFRSAQGMFDMLDVQDEADFWEAVDTTESIKQLEAVFLRTRQEIDEAAESSESSVGVLTPSGRILDVLVQD